MNKDRVASNVTLDLWTKYQIKILKTVEKIADNGTRTSEEYPLKMMKTEGRLIEMKQGSLRKYFLNTLQTVGGFLIMEKVPLNRVPPQELNTNDREK